MLFELIALPVDPSPCCGTPLTYLGQQHGQDLYRCQSCGDDHTREARSESEVVPDEEIPW